MNSRYPSSRMGKRALPMESQLSPDNNAPAASLAPAPVPTGDGARLKVLCVDDEPMVCSTIRRSLQYEKHEVEEADCGKTALELFKNAHAMGHCFDVVVSDLSMPNMDGRQVARAMRDLCSRVYIVLLTGWTPSALEDKIAGIDETLSKPPPPERPSRHARARHSSVGAPRCGRFREAIRIDLRRARLL